MAGTAINYQQATVSGSKWSRCSSVQINNPYNAQPVIFLKEEVIAVIDGVSNALKVGEYQFVTPFDPAATIQLRDPSTDQLTGGTITEGEIYAILYSLYRQVSEKAHSQINVDPTSPNSSWVDLNPPAATTTTTTTP